MHQRFAGFSRQIPTNQYLLVKRMLLATCAFTLEPPGNSSTRICAPGSSGRLKRTPQPCGFTERVWHLSENIALSESRLVTRRGICARTRVPLRCRPLPEIAIVLTPEFYGQHTRRTALDCIERQTNVTSASVSKKTGFRIVWPDAPSMRRKSRSMAAISTKTEPGFRPV